MKQFLATFLICTFFINTSVCFAQISDPVIDAQKAECVKNSAREWSVQSNRCVDKIETGTYRKDSVDRCKDVKTAEEKKNCELQLASEKAGITANAEEAMSNVSSGASQSEIINTASTILSVIGMVSSGGEASNCTSKKILTTTSTVGTITDILMKIKLKKTIQDLEDKYKADLKDNPYTAQYKALQYLKEEQEAVKDLAESEKKRQTLLMIGYAASFAMAAYEMATMNEVCTETKDAQKKRLAAEQEAKDKAAKEKADASKVAATKVINTIPAPAVTDTPNLSATPPAPAIVVTEKMPELAAAPAVPVSEITAEVKTEDASKAGAYKEERRVEKLYTDPKTNIQYQHFEYYTDTVTVSADGTKTVNYGDAPYKRTAISNGLEYSNTIPVKGSDGTTYYNGKGTGTKINYTNITSMIDIKTSTATPNYFKPKGS